jgi:hypothetical protein
VSATEAVLITIAVIALLGALAWCSYAGAEAAWRRAVGRRERLRAEVELQRLTHQAVLRMLAEARERQKPRL